jgi:hypothetical protein
MNTSLINRLLVHSTAAGILVAAATALADTSDPSKTHTLFMGADISVGTGKELYPVKDVVGSSWVVEVAGKEKVISSKEGPLNIKITPSLKLTKVSATVGNMKSERGYTEANDPVALQSRALARAASVNVGYQFANSQANAAQDHTAQQAATINNMSGANSAAMAKAGYLTGGPNVPNDVQTYAQNQALVESTQAAASAGSGLEMTGEGNSSGFDAMDVNFEVSSEKVLTNPYVVTVTRFHPKEGSAGMVQNLVYSKSLDPIGAHPSHVHLLQGGFPPNFELVDFQLHLYNLGEEVATSVSSKRVPLTGDEAFEYVKMEYMAAHGKQTLAASPLMGQLPADLPSRLAEGQYRDTVYVRVSKDGLAADAFSDASCSRRLDDPYLESVVKSIRFKPALDNGKPVEGVVPLNLTRLAI